MALTNAQIFEHVGRMLNYAYANLVTDENRYKFLTVSEWLLPVGKLYIQNGTSGTEAQRTEAMLAARKQICQILFGVNPDDGGGGAHVFTNHFLPGADVSV